jgi:predicted pyridoxine 5'-phosphate oxidase superfamily flavin-nucleotide-binding protein
VGVFHEGERAVQARAGVEAESRQLGRGISPGIPEGGAGFLAAQRIAILAGLDQAGRVWASLVVGPPGFLTAPDSRTLRLAARLPDADPLAAALSTGNALGVLVFDPGRRRRLRINGHVIDSARGDILIRTDEVFGNCPKYIQGRSPEGDTADGRGDVATRGRALTPEQRQAIEAADTFFIASVHAGRGADASHRGGQPGFVRVLDESRLRIPDYPGNNMFQTLGNITADPRVGLLFVDFETGATLQLSGRAQILWEPESFSDMTGAQRAVDVHVEEIVDIAGRGPLGWRFVDYSPFNPR